VHLDGLDLFSDLEGVLGAIAACDLVVTTSNVTAHFAGALGKETLLVYPGAESPFYYWVPGEDGRCLWYPSVRIVTAPELDTWQKVIDRVLNSSPLAPVRSP
jgi:ADP-heptose:LPS heptosyltransferase